MPRLPDNPWVIAGAKPGARLSNLNNAWLVIRARADLKDVRIHDLRHPFASRALALGKSLPRIGKLLGHRKVQTTVRYAHLRTRFGEGVGGAHRRELPGGHGRYTMSGAMIAGRPLAACVLAAVAALALAGAARAETWRDLTVAPEERCAVYDRQRDYRYPPSIEHEIVRRLGAVYGPYTGTCFASTSETDIEHIVATSEAHDSGLCARDRAPRARDVVYRLSGQLIDEIWQLQLKVGGAPAPVRELDRTDPGWRNRLPLLVPDDVARALLNPLVEEAVKLARGGASGLRMRRTLRAVGDDWTLRGEVVVPTSISEPQLVELFGAEASQLPSRFQLYIEDESRSGGLVSRRLGDPELRGRVPRSREPRDPDRVAGSGKGRAGQIRLRGASAARGWRGVGRGDHRCDLRLHPSGV